MFSLEYEDWKTICSQIFAMKEGRKKYYLQWYPLYKLSSRDRKQILSEEYFDTFVNNGLFLFYPETWLLCNNYILKGDGNFRNASLVSPIFFLLFLAVGKKISRYFKSDRQNDILVYYAGNYIDSRYYYEKDYDNFFKSINNMSHYYSYYLKTDIKDFFSNIDVNILFKIINNRVNSKKTNISQKEFMIYKELLLYLGNGEFPLIENSTASSFLSTVIYLENPDKNLHCYLKNKENAIIEFAMVRYVDDLYILFNSDINYSKLSPLINRIINYYSSELKKINLSLNRNKTVFNRTSEINNELKKSLYDERYNRKEFKIINLVNKNILVDFLKKIKISLNKCELNTSKFSEIVDDVFKIENAEYSPQEVFNGLVFQDHPLYKQKAFIKEMFDLISTDYNFLKLDPKRFTILLLKTNDEPLIKAFLNILFKNHKNGIWDVYDISLAINYFIQRGFQHTDLLKIIEKEEENIFRYYELFCRQSFLLSYFQSKNGFILSFYDNFFYKKDEKLLLLFFMYKVELRRDNYLAMFAYFKNFFDRISAHFALYISNDGSKEKPNYKKYYDDKRLKQLYSDVENSKKIIGCAHKIRNANPLSHASSELLDKNDTKENIIQSIKDLTSLIVAKIRIHTNAS